MVRKANLIVVTAMTVSLTVSDRSRLSAPSNVDPLTLRVLRHSSGVTNSITNSLGLSPVLGKNGRHAISMFSITRISGAEIPGMK